MTYPNLSLGIPIVDLRLIGAINPLIITTLIRKIGSVIPNFTYGYLILLIHVTFSYIILIIKRVDTVVLGDRTAVPQCIQIWRI